MAPGCCRTIDIHMNLQLQHDLGQQTKVVKVASRGSMDHIGLSTRPNSETNLGHPIIAQNQDNHIVVQHVQGLSYVQAPGCVTQPCHPTLRTPQPSLTPITTSLNPHSVVPSFPPLHLISFIKVAWETSVCHTVYFSFVQVAFNANIHYISHWSGSRVLVSVTYWTIAATHLRYSAVAQN